jgi:hypothetical protein
MNSYTFPVFVDVLKNNSTIQTIIAVDALAAPVKANLTATTIAETAEMTTAIAALWNTANAWANYPVAVYLDQLIMNYYLPSLGSQTPAPDTKKSAPLATRVAEIQRLNGLFPKVKFTLWGRNSATAAWVWLNVEVVQNYGDRVNYLNLLTPYLSQGDLDIFGRYTQIGIQFSAEALTKTTLPQAGDFITIKGAVRIECGGDEKKNSDVNLGALKKVLTATKVITMGEDDYAAGTPEYVPCEGAVPGDMCFAAPITNQPVGTFKWWTFHAECTTPNMVNVICMTSPVSAIAQFSNVTFRVIVFKF